MTCNVGDGCSSLEGAKAAAALVVVQDRGGALMVGGHALAKSLPCIILTMHEWLTSDIVLTLNLGRIELEMV